MKTQPIIFLDIDGVLNCQIFYDEQPFPKDEEVEDYKKSQLCSKRISWLNELCEETNAVIVISSSWRSGETIESMQIMMNNSGATFKIIGLTPYTGYERGTEIAKWLRDNINKESYGCNYYDFYKYAIIDDDNDMLLTQQYNFFQVDNYSGLTPTTCYRIKNFFLHKTF